MPASIRPRSNHARIRALLKQRDGIKGKCFLLLDSGPLANGSDSIYLMMRRLLAARKSKQWPQLCDHESINTELNLLVASVIARFVVPWYDSLGPESDNFLGLIHRSMCELVCDLVRRISLVSHDTNTMWDMLESILGILDDHLRHFVVENDSSYPLVSIHKNTFRSTNAWEKASWKSKTTDSNKGGVDMDFTEIVRDYLAFAHGACSDPLTYYTEMAHAMVKASGLKALPATETLASLIIAHHILRKLHAHILDPQFVLGIIANWADSCCCSISTSATAPETGNRILVSSLFHRFWPWPLDPPEYLPGPNHFATSRMWLLMRSVLGLDAWPIVGGIAQTLGQWAMNSTRVVGFLDNLASCAVASAIDKITVETVVSYIIKTRTMVEGTEILEKDGLESSTQRCSTSDKDGLESSNQRHSPREKDGLESSNQRYSTIEVSGKVAAAYMRLIDSLPWPLKLYNPINAHLVRARAIRILDSFSTPPISMPQPSPQDPADYTLEKHQDSADFTLPPPQDPADYTLPPHQDPANHTLEKHQDHLHINQLWAARCIDVFIKALYPSI